MNREGSHRKRAVGMWVVFVVTVAVCAGLGYAAYTLAGVSWDAVVSYESPYAGIELEPARSGSAVTSRTVLVIVDGLRSDAAEEMGTLSTLRNYGASYRLVAPQPSLSYPNWTSILTGAPPYVSGVVTNWHEGASPVESIFDTAKRTGVKVVFAGPEDFETLYGVRSKTVGSFLKKWDKEYLTSEYVDAALSLARKHDPSIIVVHLPDVDEAGHAYGGASAEYTAVTHAVDADLNRLVSALQDGRTTFLIVSDHGHIDTGGHGGWEAEVIRVPLVMAGPGVNLVSANGYLESVAPTVAYLSGIPVPRHALRGPLTAAVGSSAASDPRMSAQVGKALRAYTAAVSGAPAPNGKEPGREFAAALSRRESEDRSSRLLTGVLGAAASLLALVLIGLASWRALLAVLSGTAAYYAVYNLLFFVIHGYKWSLSAFNSEDLIQAWMNVRLVEAAASAIVAAAVAALVYPLLRSRPKGPWGRYLAGWLTLGPATALAVLSTLGMQIAWFVWWWGIDPQWRLPDLEWGFKYDLDLIQATAVGFSALLLPVVTYLVGRYHPRVRHMDDDGDAPAAGAPVPREPLVPAGVGSASVEE